MTTPEAFYRQMAKEFSPEDFRRAAGKGKEALSALHLAYAAAIDVVADLHEENGNVALASIFRISVETHRGLAQQVLRERP